MMARRGKMNIGPIYIGSQNTPATDYKCPPLPDLSDIPNVDVISVPQNSDIADCFRQWRTIQDLFPSSEPVLIEKLVTIGANGSIYKVSDSDSNNTYIVKTISRAPSARDSKHPTIIRDLHQINYVLSGIDRHRTAAEMCIAPQVVGQVAIFSTPQAVVIGFVMEFLAGFETLYDVVCRGEVQDKDIQLAAQLLSDLHALNIISGDPNLGNFMVNTQTGEMRLVDFDMSEVVDEEGKKEDIQAFNSHLLCNGLWIDLRQ